MRRYLFWIQYLGTNFSGWQIQPNAASVQGTVEQAFQWIFKDKEIQVAGCGRTDAGVHASAFAFHVDLSAGVNTDRIHKLNQILSPDIQIVFYEEVSPSMHARFSATRRTYKYLIDLEQPLFVKDCVYKYPGSKSHLDFDLLNQTAASILNYEEFFPFCKSKSDTKHYKCLLYKSEWEVLNSRYLIYTVQANRFLRGMVRLIAGTSLRVAEGKLGLKEVRSALDNQIRLKTPFSIPSTGLFLYEVKYEDHDINYPANTQLFFPI